MAPANIDARGPLALFCAALACLEVTGTLTAESDALLAECAAAVARAHIFSSNEEIADLHTANLPLLLVDAVAADAAQSTGVADAAVHVGLLTYTEKKYESYLQLCDSYGILAPYELADKSAVTGLKYPPAELRALKIARFKRRQLLSARTLSLRQRLLHQTRVGHSPEFLPTDLLCSTVLAAPLSASTAKASAVLAGIEAYSPPGPTTEPDDEELARAFCLSLVACWAAKAVDELIFIAQERPMAEMRRAHQKSAENNTAVRDLDDDRLAVPAKMKNGSASGPILDKQGRPLRPFVLVSKRNELMGQVFRAGHTLPIMSIDEYVSAEIKRGGILPKSKDTHEVEEEDSDREETSEMKTYKARHWDNYTGANKRGSGNMGGNRG